MITVIFLYQVTIINRNLTRLTFSTTDLKHWHQHPVGLDISAFKWADSKQAFAGHVAKRNGKYYLTYAVSWPERMGYSYKRSVVMKTLEYNSDGSIKPIDSTSGGHASRSLVR